MNVYAVILSAKALDWLEECRDARLKRRVADAIDALMMNARPPGCVKLAGDEDVWRVRVGDYRILYEIHHRRLVVVIIDLGHRKEIYE